MRRFLSLVAAMLMVPALAMGAHPGAQPGTRPAQAAAPSSPVPAPASPTAPTPGPDQVGEDSDYIIGPGDVIQVFVWQEPELSVSVPVRADGKVTTPLVEDIVAVGLTPSALARAMEERLTKYIKSPQVNIMVTSAQSQMSKITVIGEVKNAGTVPYRNGLTVLDVVMTVGGLAEFAAGNRAEVVRKDASGKEVRIRVKLADLINKAQIDENVDVQPGDIVLVPKSRF